MVFPENPYIQQLRATTGMTKPLLDIGEQVIKKVFAISIDRINYLS